MCLGRRRFFLSSVCAPCVPQRSQMSYQSSRERSEAVKSLTQDDLEEIREAFKLFDTDDSGKVCRPTCMRGRDEARGSRAERSGGGKAEAGAAPAGRRRMQRWKGGPSRRAPPTSDPTFPRRDRSMRTS